MPRALKSQPERVMSTRFFGSLPTTLEEAGRVHTSNNPSDKMDLILQEVREQRQSLKFVEEQCDHVLSIVDTVVRSVDEVKESLSILETRIDQLDSENSPSLSKSNIKCPKELSSAVKKLYSELEDDEQFDSTKSFSDNYNKRVTDNLKFQISSEFSGKFKDAQISRCIYRYYESRRRLFLDSLPGRVERKIQNDKKTKISQRQRSLYWRRKRALKGNEISYWNQIDFNYMSNESSDEEGGATFFNVHQPKWRSKALNNLVRKLDERIKKSETKGSRRTGFQRFERRLSHCSSSKPPKDAPAWSIDPPPTTSSVVQRSPSDSPSSNVSPYGVSMTNTPTSHNNSSSRILNSSSLTPNRRYATHYSEVGTSVSSVNDENASPVNTPLANSHRATVFPVTPVSRLPLTDISRGSNQKRVSDVLNELEDSDDSEWEV